MYVMRMTAGDRDSKKGDYVATHTINEERDVELRNIYIISAWGTDHGKKGDLPEL